MAADTDYYGRAPQLFAELTSVLRALGLLPGDDVAALEARQGVKLLKLPVQPHIKTLDISLLDMEAGSRRSVVRSTASRVLAVIKGSGTMRMGETEIHWNAGDVMAVPCWCAHEIVADQPARFLEVCDEPTMRALGFYREAQA